MADKNRTLDIKGIFEKFSGKKFRIVLVSVGLLGVVIIFLSEFIGTSSSGKRQTTCQDADVSSYEKALENRLEGILSKMYGVGRVNVMVTVESGVQNVYEQDNKVSSDRTEQKGGESNQTQENNSNEDSAVVIDSGTGQQALVKMQLQPSVQGVVVVCDGGSNPDVQLSVTEAVSKALGLPTNDISVNKMQS